MLSPVPFTGEETRLWKVPGHAQASQVGEAELSPDLVDFQSSFQYSEGAFSIKSVWRWKREKASTFSQAKYGVKIFLSISISNYKKIFWKYSGIQAALDKAFA